MSMKPTPLVIKNGIASGGAIEKRHDEPPTTTQVLARLKERVEKFREPEDHNHGSCVDCTAKAYEQGTNGTIGQFLSLIEEVEKEVVCL